jgi:hypothetical protein
MSKGLNNSIAFAAAAIEEKRRKGRPFKKGQFYSKRDGAVLAQRAGLKPRTI